VYEAMNAAPNGGTRQVSTSFDVHRVHHVVGHRGDRQSGRQVDDGVDALEHCVERGGVQEVAGADVNARVRPPARSPPGQQAKPVAPIEQGRNHRLAHETAPSGEEDDRGSLHYEIRKAFGLTKVGELLDFLVTDLEKVT
jgi:hypothetical protein